MVAPGGTKHKADKAAAAVGAEMLRSHTGQDTDAGYATHITTSLQTGACTEVDMCVPGAGLPHSGRGTPPRPAAAVHGGERVGVSEPPGGAAAALPAGA